MDVRPQLAGIKFAGPVGWVKTQHISPLGRPETLAVVWVLRLDVEMHMATGAGCMRHRWGNPIHPDAYSSLWRNALRTGAIPAFSRFRYRIGKIFCYIIGNSINNSGQHDSANYDAADHYDAFDNYRNGRECNNGHQISSLSCPGVFSALRFNIRAI